MRGKEAYEFLVKNKDLIRSFTLIDVEYQNTKWIHNHHISELEEKLFINDLGFWEDEYYEGWEQATEDGMFYTYLHSIQMKDDYEMEIVEWVKSYADEAEELMRKKRGY